MTPGASPLDPLHRIALGASASPKGRYDENEENQEAGRRLGAWYQSDRILGWEASAVTICD
ncbi:hypothetical protein [Streptomyces lunalinharesii]|uniref:Uncharacterized protein n=1 Tax=Streptomyces lunalinharesii TaxID=333384 RepID=A0ABN3SR05_9ACTN